MIEIQDKHLNFFSSSVWVINLKHVWNEEPAEKVDPRLW